MVHDHSRTSSVIAANVCEGMMERDSRPPELSPEEEKTVAIFERCAPSVCHINTTTLVEERGRFEMNLAEVPHGSGTGFVWDSQHVVTNFHVVKDARRALVTVGEGGQTYQATLVGTEPDADLAVLKLERPGEKEPLKPLLVGTSRHLRVGQRVFAIGNPFGLDQTLTSGLVSGLGREMQGVSGRTIRGLIQTDAAINPGNSGGPLLDNAGRLIGVNTMIASPSGAFAGVGFAIPVDTMVRVVKQLVQHGRTIRPWLGVYCANAEMTRNIRNAEGVFVLGVEDGSPADDAGLIPMARTRQGVALGDEILEVEGKKVENPEELMDAVEGHMIGQAVDLTIRRQGKVGTVSVKLGTRPNSGNAKNTLQGDQAPFRDGAGGGFVQGRPRSRL